MPNQTANAQASLGIDVGPSNNTYHLSRPNKNLRLSAITGFMINLNTSLSINSLFTFECATGIIQKNYSVQNQKSIKQVYQNTYLHFPFSVQYKIPLFNKFHLSTSIGLYYAYWLTGKISGVAPNIFELSSSVRETETLTLDDLNERYRFTELDQRQEFGGLSKIGLRYLISNTISCKLDLHYYRGLTSQQKQNSVLQSRNTNQTTVITYGVTYSF